MMGFGMGGFGSLLLLVLVGLAVWYFVKERDSRREPGTGAGPRSDDAALRLLRERYARGEIDKDEFDERRRELSRQD